MGQGNDRGGASPAKPANSRVGTTRFARYSRKAVSKRPAYVVFHHTYSVNPAPCLRTPVPTQARLLRLDLSRRIVERVGECVATNSPALAPERTEVMRHCLAAVPTRYNRAALLGRAGPDRPQWREGARGALGLIGHSRAKREARSAERGARSKRDRLTDENESIWPLCS